MTTAGKKVHLVGIGGSGMQGLAGVLLARGCTVSGSDTTPSSATERLIQLGAEIHIGQDADNVAPDVDFVVYSAAIKPDNPELLAAACLDIPRLKYAEMLGHLMGDRYGICVAGTHGKSTTSAMVGCILFAAELDPTVVVGAGVKQLGGSARAGAGEHFVVESCEYDRSFLNLMPRSAAILNIEHDHLDFYKDLGEIIEAFRGFARLVPDDGLIVANGQCREVARALAEVAAPVETFGIDVPATWRAVNVQEWHGNYAFDCVYKGRLFGRFSLRIPGKHNVMNALAAVALSHAAGVEAEVMESALAVFQGADRRFDVRGQWEGITLVDDYAHHPTEIKATLKAAHKHFPDRRRIWVVFQPHQHSRTRFLLKDFADSFANADIILVPDIFFVRDSQEEKGLISSRDLVREIGNQGGEARYLPELDDICDHLGENLRPGDVLITMGAGNVWKVADALAGRLQRNTKAG